MSSLFVLLFSSGSILMAEDLVGDQNVIADPLTLELGNLSVEGEIMVNGGVHFGFIDVMGDHGALLNYNSNRNALMLGGNSVLKGNVVIEQAQGDVSMGIYE